MRISEYELKQRQDAEKKRKERDEEAEYYRMESLGIQQQSTPTRWMRGDYG
ncbi:MULTISPECIES: hypothetical protein [unclassified Providencia]|uniref:hypothetical protein n=1 Tax=Providencia TaxID=586 RepID=UPI0012B6498F|nr:MULTISPECIES: hypothetical protein [unclassified Providencia]MTB40773.1 hypothetical protein [Providencia sp. wls1949]MTC08571.1 hypothetical protein [Providencia sp. wls1948]HEM8344472.1 hypothetical protein [Providencia stuartii]